MSPLPAMLTRSKLLAGASFFAVLLWGAVLLAQVGAGFQYKVQNVVQAGEGEPKLILQATGAIKKGTVHFERDDGESFEASIEGLSKGSTKEIPIEQDSGTHTWTVRIEATGNDDETVTSSFDTKVTVAEALKIDVEKNRAQVAKGKLKMRSNRPIERVDITVLDSDGGELYSGTDKIGGKKGTFTINWPAEEDAAAIKLEAHDVDGFWRGLMLQPFWVEIPHDEVRFNFGKATWDDEQEPKLESTLEEIRKAMQKHGDKGLQMQLYIAGYTDTVGSKSENMKLSEKRARAIARWFKKHGLDIPVYYQGFGESVLAVETPDETKNKENRRALYILGNAAPPTSESLPKSDWKRVE